MQVQMREVMMKMINDMVYRNTSENEDNELEVNYLNLFSFE